MSENLCLKEGQTSVGLVCLYYTVLSVLCSLVITCWEMAYHLSLLCIMFPCVFVTFPYGVSGHVWYLIVAIPDLCNSTILIEHTVSKQWLCFVCQCPTKKTARPTGVYLLDFFCSGIQFNLLLSPYPCFISLLYLDLYVLGDDALIS